MNRADLLNAFRPASEVDDPQLFAGRQEQVEKLTDALHTIGSVPIIYGHRGLGKSSLALQMQRIAMGDVELLSRRGSSTLALSAEQAYLTFYITCTDAIKNVRSLLQTLLNTMESIQYTQDANGRAQHLVDRTTRKKLTFKLFEVESTKRYESAKSRVSNERLSLEEKIVELVDLISDIYQQPVLFIIDEFDRIANTANIASLLKAISSEQLKFLLVGIGSSIADLLTDHQSLERQLVPVQVPLMNRLELREIVRSAERILEEKCYLIQFSDQGRNLLTKVASGFPWFVHVLGQATLVNVTKTDRQIVEREDVVTALNELVRNRFAQQFSDMYQNAVRDSAIREMVLRAFAEWNAENIPTSEVYRLLKGKLDVSNPSIYKGHLASAEFGSIIFSPAFQSRGLVRFRNQMFKVYVKLRSSIYKDVADQVNAAYNELRETKNP
jgi:hypothetical protein